MRNVIELALTLRRPVEELDPLTIVDFHECDLDRSVGLRQRERLFEAEEVLVKGPGFCEVADKHGQVRNAEDLRTGHGYLGGRRHRECERSGQQQHRQHVHGPQDTPGGDDEGTKDGVARSVLKRLW